MPSITSVTFQCYEGLQFNSGTLQIKCYSFLPIKLESCLACDCMNTKHGVKYLHYALRDLCYKPLLTHFPRHGIAQPSLALEMSLLPSDDSCMMKRELKPGSEHGCLPCFLPHPMLFEVLGGILSFFFLFFLHHQFMHFFWAPEERGFESESVTKLSVQHHPHPGKCMEKKPGKGDGLGGCLPCRFSILFSVRRMLTRNM